MSHKKVLSVGSILVFGIALTVSGAFSQTRKNAGQSQPASRSEMRAQFIDQDCDGVNDQIRDHDNDGIPNGLDPDWSRPKDGTGFQSRNGKGGGAGQGAGFNNKSFRGGQGGGSFGGGVCDGTGPKGKGPRKGR
jgi:hypothetical protein